MIEINIYQAQKFDFKIEFPSSWNELQQDEIIFIAKTLLAETDAASVRALILKHLIEKRAAPNPKNKLPKDWFFYIDYEQAVQECFPLLDFIFKENNLTNTPDPITFGNHTFYPQPFKNITCAEYEDAEVAANLFALEPSQDSLANLAAILFRPLSTADRAKEIGHHYVAAEIQIEPYLKFNERTNYYYPYQADQKVKYFKTLPPEQLYAIFIWYAGARAELPKMFPNVFSGSGSEEKDLMAFTKCIHSGAGPKNGTRQQIRVTGLFEFMLDMDEEARKAKELEEELERMKRQ